MWNILIMKYSGQYFIYMFCLPTQYNPNIPQKHNLQTSMGLFLLEQELAT